jgi:putative membrane protein
VLRILTGILLLVVAVFGLSFALLNADPVSLDYYLGQAQLPLSLALVGSLVIGALLGMFAAIGLLARQRREAWRLRRELVQARRELAELRKLPVQDAR